MLCGGLDGCTVRHFLRVLGICCLRSEPVLRPRCIDHVHRARRRRGLLMWCLPGAETGIRNEALTPAIQPVALIAPQKGADMVALLSIRRNFPGQNLTTQLGWSANDLWLVPLYAPQAGQANDNPR